MKKAIAAVLVAILTASGLLAGCAGVLKGSGNLSTEEYEFSDFTDVHVGSTFEVAIAHSGSYSVSITADDNLFKYIEVSKDGETLKIGLKPIVSLGRVTLKAKITMPQLRGLDLSGVTRGAVSGFSSTDNVDFEVSGVSSLDLMDISTGDVKLNIFGASKVTGDLKASDSDFEVSGASSVQLEGSASDIVVNASGASRVKLAAFLVNNARVTLSAASSGTVRLVDGGRLDADLSGASKLEYVGEQITMGTINTSGASTLNKQ